MGGGVKTSSTASALGSGWLSLLDRAGSGREGATPRRAFEDAAVGATARTHRNSGTKLSARTKGKDEDAADLGHAYINVFPKAGARGPVVTGGAQRPAQQNGVPQYLPVIVN
ncbi:hypothetical protein BE221DRAFT_49617, partial [Ostreococcus tauri]